jgi:hypothetical protein
MIVRRPIRIVERSDFGQNNKWAVDVNECLPWQRLKAVRTGNW